MITFGGFTCIGPNTIIEIKRKPAGLYFECADGKNYLEQQIDKHGYCLGLTALV